MISYGRADWGRKLKGQYMMAVSFSLTKKENGPRERKTKKNHTLKAKGTHIFQTNQHNHNVIIHDDNFFSPAFNFVTASLDHRVNYSQKVKKN